jgi:uncharacterized cupredoxin-like copper-binding protein
MFPGNRIRIVIYTALMALVVTACASSDTAGTTLAADGDDHGEFTFGEPASAGDADRTIEIAANDNLTFDPAEIEVSAGETITFVVANTGQVPHDFTIGDQTTQDAHEAEMVEMMEAGEMMQDEDNAVALQAGETKELTWRFTESGTVLLGCHQPGHYAGGMKATVDVS